MNLLRNLLALLGLLAGLPTVAGSFSEDFSAKPVASGWRCHGDTNLFQWDAAHQNLRVTWDSSRTNSYFHRPLGTILTDKDDFQLSFDLTFEDYAGGVTPGKPGAFEAAVGFMNLDQAMHPDFSRGAGRNATYGPRNLVEFDFFPAFGSFLPTIAQVIVGTNHNDWLFNHDNLQPMSPGQTFRVEMNYAAAIRILTTTVSHHAAQYGPTQTILVPPSVVFRVATLAVSSYSDVRSQDSILAHGTVDNFQVVTPPPPVAGLFGSLLDGQWQVQFSSRSNWLYALERSIDWTTWAVLTTNTPGNGAVLLLTDPSPPATGAGYRVRAQRP